MVINGAPLVFLEISDRNLAVIDEQVGKRKLARGRRSLRQPRRSSLGGIWLGVLSQRGEVSNVLGTAHQFDVRMGQFQRVDLNFLTQQRPELYAHGKFVCRGERV